MVSSVIVIQTDFHAECVFILSGGVVMAAPVACQLVLYTNDAVDISYADGSRLQLSPCATTFVYHRAPDTYHHPLHSKLQLLYIDQCGTLGGRPRGFWYWK